VEDFYDTMASDTHLAWPGDLPNFDLDTCEIGAAMCCWPQDRQANDNNGNCNKQYDVNCVDKDPADNTDLCYVDMSRAPSFNKETAGFMTFPGDDNGGEGAIHCHGFAWAEDDGDPSSRYKANNLFYVSMYDHMLQRGYVRNIPGSPMCGCIEQMPTATRSDCTQIDVDETYRITKTAEGMTATIESIDIDFNSCQGVNNRNNDLSAYFHQLHEDGKVSNDKRAALGNYLVENDNCPAATAYFLSTKGYVEGYNYDKNAWDQFAEKREGIEISMGSQMFNIVLEGSPNGIVRRICPTCADSHRDIYYRRETSVGNTDILNKFLNKWDNGPGNRFEEDYNLYSTYEDAKAKKNAWKFCNASTNRGFPNECGPTSQVSGQSSRFNNNSGQSNVVFLLEKGSSADFGSVSGDLYSGDIGGVKISGSASISTDGKFYVTNAGVDIWGRNDQFNFVRQDGNGDVTVKVFVNALMKTHDWAKAGLMIRQDESSNSRNFACLAPARRKPYSTFRRSTQENTNYMGNPQTINSFAPVWLKITKTGGEFKCLSSSNGNNWYTIGTTWMQFNSNSYLVGMAVTSHNADEVTEAQFQYYSSSISSGDQTGNNSLDDYKFYPRESSSGNDITQLSQGAGVEFYADWCNQRADCKGFNSNGWMKKVIKPRNQWSTVFNDSSKGFYVKENGDNPLMNYQFTARKSSSGNDITQLSQNAGVENYAKWCNQRADCKGFNSNGWMKRSIKPVNQWSTVYNESWKGFYLKV